jgi:carbonic anhydrase/acetyltransferase-like protein (isoleucine patch superfamily)
MKYELTNETVTLGNRTILKRIRYLDSGKLGGFIENEHNLSHAGKARVIDNAKVYGNAQVFGNALVFGNAQVFGNVKVSEDAHIYGNVKVSEDAHIFEDACVYGDARVTENAYIHGYARVYGNTWIYGDVDVCGHAQIYEDASVCGHTHISGKARVYGVAHILGGKWNISPLQIYGSRYFFNVASEKTIAIGYTIKTAEEWRDTYLYEFDKHKFTAKERLEYIRYFNLASKLYNFGFELPEE